MFYSFKPTSHPIHKPSDTLRQRSAEFTAQLPIGPIFFSNDQMFTASSQVFFAVCSALDRGFNAELPNGWRWVPAATAAA